MMAPRFVVGELVRYRQGETRGDERTVLEVVPGFHEDGELDGLVVRRPDGQVSGMLRADWFGPVFAEGDEVKFRNGALALFPPWRVLRVVPGPVPEFASPADGLVLTDQEGTAWSAPLPADLFVRADVAVER